MTNFHSTEWMLLSSCLNSASVVTAPSLIGGFLFGIMGSVVLHPEFRNSEAYLIITE